MTTENTENASRTKAELLEFYASCPEGFEETLERELREIGTRHLRRLKGRVAFMGRARDAYRVCLWSRLASRVFLVIARIDARNGDVLYEGARALPWEDVLKTGASISVAARGTNEELRNSHFAALKVKDAICDRMADRCGSRPDVDTDAPDARIALSIRGDRASLHLDLSGDPLFKRLPREAARLKAARILRPDYAALVLAQAGWPEACRGTRQGGGAGPVLVDISCSGGGIELEAVSQALDRAPGSTREHWGFMGWARHDEEAWQELLAEADERAGDARAYAPTVIACDADGNAMEFARRIIRKAGFARYVTFSKASADEILAHLDGTPTEGPRQHDATALPQETDRDEAADGTVPAPQPLGAMITDVTEIPLTKIPQVIAMASALRNDSRSARLPFAVLARDELLSKTLGIVPEKILAIKPNNEDALILRFPAAVADARKGDGGALENAAAGNREEARRAQAIVPGTVIDLGDGVPIPVLLPESEQFARRLRKVARLRRKWAAREGITCYRVYDADLPDYSAAIDLYTGSAATPGTWLVIAEYAAPKSVDPQLAQARMLDILAIAPHVLEIDPDCVYARARMRSRGGSQYGRRTGAQPKPGIRDGGGRGDAGRTGGKPAHKGAGPADAVERRLPLIEEGGLTFAVNFDDYLDTGIFLDHRITRGIIRERARDARWFLNLFAYTGTATCYAADAGVEETVTVDLSNTYLDWAERNMRQNGFTGPEHHFVRADVRQWIADMRETPNRWDLIFCDPPTFSNSSKMGNRMGGRTFDVQRDHVELLIGISRLLTREGEAIFSCNLRTFRPDTRALARAGVVLTDITEQTIPEDFSRNRRIHRCYIVRRYEIERAMELAGMSEEEIEARRGELKTAPARRGRR